MLKENTLLSFEVENVQYQQKNVAGGSVFAATAQFKGSILSTESPADGAFC